MATVWDDGTSKVWVVKAVRYFKLRPPCRMRTGLEFIQCLENLLYTVFLVKIRQSVILVPTLMIIKRMKHEGSYDGLTESRKCQM